MERNNAFAWMVVDYLDRMPRAINPKILKEAGQGLQVPEERLYASVMSALCGSTPDTDLYFYRSVERLDPDEFRRNPYLKNIEFPDADSGKWEFKHDSYAPYEAFIRDDIEVLPDGTEIPLIGYFPEKFSFPSVHEGGREWMAVKPSEINSMKEPLEAMHGRIAVIGLGLGYFAFMASLKDEVTRIDIVEKDPDVISLFRELILPQFPFNDNVDILQEDAFSFLGKEKGHDCVFVDIWHDTADGTELYLKAKALEKEGTTYRYWAEKSLLSALRWREADAASGA